jgi:hypothetical protein
MGQAMRHADLSLTVSQRKLACVMDPALVLGHALGPTLALRLTRVFEAWLTRSFWQVIDASELVLHRLAGNAVDDVPPAMQPDPQALSAWIAMRDSTDAGSWVLRWMGDCLAESQVRDGGDPLLLDRYEALVAALVERVQQAASPVRPAAPLWRESLDPMMAGLDTAALSASLDGALVLSPASPSGGVAPWPVQALARAGLRACQLDPMPADTLFAAERQLVREALACAGLATLAEQLPPLAVIHVLAHTLAPSQALADGDTAPDPWAGAQAWWYPV